MDDMEKLDVGWALKHGLTDIDQAHEQRLAAEALAAEEARSAERTARQRAKQAKDARMVEILTKHPDRFAVSINGRLVVPGKKSVELACPCGFKPQEILDRLGEAMEYTFNGVLAENFTNHNGQARVVVSDLNCPSCGKKVLYRLIPIPW
jgi:predicted RNA-binding Zn-ribbon protein involved in translation (DUF1610 family)